MLFNFIGCPQSGKTTTAAMLFAGLKETGVVAEFCPEQARYYIAKLRVTNNLLPEDPLTLTDEDQYNIMKAQVENDETFVKACGRTVMIVSDSSPLNSLLYMTPDFRKSKEVQELVERSRYITDASFYAHPIYRPYVHDPNRIHSEAQARLIDKQIPDLLKLYPTLPVVEIDGSVTERLLLVQNRVFFA